MGQINQPNLNEELGMLELSELRKRVPTCDERRAIIPRDALGCVDVFRTIAQLVMEYIFGVRCCIKCQNCTCSDLFGSNTKPEGGFLGRVDAIYGSIEAQKSAGSLHVHFQVFVECLHQHTPLHTLLLEHRSELATLFVEYAKYKAQVCRQVYEDLPGWQSRQTETESTWKQQYDSSIELIDTPPFLTKLTSPSSKCTPVMETSIKARMYKPSRVWLKRYLQNVQRRQEMRQNHVHVWNEKM